jgi:hypothetical protein
MWRQTAISEGSDASFCISQLWLCLKTKLTDLKLRLRWMICMTDDKVDFFLPYPVTNIILFYTDVFILLSVSATCLWAAGYQENMKCNN